MNVEHIEWQMVGALIYLLYTLFMLIRKRTVWQKRKTILIGFTPTLLIGLVFMLQYYLEFAYMDTYMPASYTSVFASFYANINILAFLSGITAVGYLMFQGTGVIAQEIRNSANHFRKFQINSERDCIDAIDASADYLRNKENQRESEKEEARLQKVREEDEWREANSRAAEDEYWHGRPGY